jgi:CBS-domain-containing membrane protein
MCAKDIMQKEVLWGNADDSVQQALTKMQQADAGYMMVGKEGSIEGIVSTFDIAAALSVYLKPMFAKWRRPIDDATLQIKIKWIMTRPVCTIKPDTSVAAIMENMRQSGLCCLPVADQKGNVDGLVTVFDIFKALLNTDSGSSTAGKTPQAPSLV